MAAPIGTTTSPNRSRTTHVRQPSRATENLPSSFTTAIKNRIKMATEERCFMCGHRAQHCAHVIADADQSISILKKRGLVNFRLVSVENGVALCAGCHLEYDDHCDPKLIFYPCDIRFFIKFELRDRARRQADGSQRRVPTARQYTRWCGLYSRIFFDWLGQDKVMVDEPAEWRGAPLAALRRAFGIMGCPRAAGIPRGDLQDLRVLWDLYYSEDDSLAAQIASQYGAGPENSFGLADFDDSNSDKEEPRIDSASKGGDADEDIAERGDAGLDVMDSEVQDDEDEIRHSKRRAIAGTWSPPVFNIKHWRWEFGPDSSSNDKARELFGPTSFA